MRARSRKQKAQKMYVVVYDYTGSHDTFVGTKDEVLEQLQQDVKNGELENIQDVHVYELGKKVGLFMRTEIIKSVEWIG